jgi:hypothetical protein
VPTLLFVPNALKGKTKSIVLVSALALCYVASAHKPPSRAGVIKVTLYDSANVRPAVLLDAITQLRLIFGQAGVGLDIAVGDPEDEDATLFTYVPAPDKNQVKEAACHALRDIRVKIIGSSPAALNNNVLGMSSPFARAGLNVRLFSDHIQHGADRHGKPYSRVLSYAIAHEIGHVLLRSGGHGVRGIMSGLWTAHEYSEMDRGGGLLFTSAEAKEMASNIAGISCPIN